MNTDNLTAAMLVVVVLILSYVLACQRDELAQLNNQVNQTNQILQQILDRDGITLVVRKEQWNHIDK